MTPDHAARKFVNDWAGEGLRLADAMRDLDRRVAELIAGYEARLAALAAALQEIKGRADAWAVSPSAITRGWLLDRIDAALAAGWVG